VVPTVGLRIGRAPGNDVVIDDPQVSRTHAVITLTEGAPVIDASASANGIIVEGRAVQHAAAHDGTAIILGSTVILFTKAAAPAQTRGTRRSTRGPMFVAAGAGAAAVLVVAVLVAVLATRGSGSGDADGSTARSIEQAIDNRSGSELAASLGFSDLDAASLALIDSELASLPDGTAIDVLETTIVEESESHRIERIVVQVQEPSADPSRRSLDVMSERVDGAWVVRGSFPSEEE